MKTYQRAQRDAYDAFNGYCNIAQWNILTGLFFPEYEKFSPEWAIQMNLTGAQYFPRTSHLNGAQIGGGNWGNFSSSVTSSRIYVTHKYRPLDMPTVFDPTQNFSQCNVGMTGPWANAAIKDFQNPAFVSRPPSGPQPTPKVHTAILGPGSSGMATVGTQSPIPLSLSGNVALTLSDCVGNTCVAQVTSLRVSSAPFVFRGLQVDALELRSNTNSTGVLQGDTLLFNQFSGSIYIHLRDGRYQFAPVSAGSILADWDAEAGSFVMAFSFSGKFDGDPLELSGTAFSQQLNTPPTARISISSPAASTIAGESATVECVTPAGTTVVLDGDESSDVGSVPKFAWYIDSIPATSARSITLPALPIGTTAVSLMAYDQGGLAGEHRIALSIVDTTAPEIQANDICVYPPNHHELCIDIFDDLHAASSDACENIPADSLAITAVSATPSLLSHTEREICFRTERDGASSAGQVITVTLESKDSYGNSAVRNVNITIPHDRGGTDGCLKSKHFEKDARHR